MNRLHFSLPRIGIMLAALVAMIALGPISLYSQSSYGSIVGAVTDSRGAVVPRATVTTTNLSTNEQKVEKSDATGNFRIVELVPATYTVTIEMSGFKRTVLENVTVLVDESTRIDAALQIGSATETVEVTSTVPLIQTDSGTLGSVVEGKTVEEMPLNGRNTMNLIQLVPGVVPQGSTQGSLSMNQGTHTNNAGWGNYQIGGSIAGQGTINIDGAPNNILGGNNVAYVPVQDAIQEFKVSTSVASPEFGRYGGGVVEMTTKAGSNAFHGTAYEFLRNTVLDANGYAYNQVPTNKGTSQKLNQNQYGFQVGGPIKRDKAFFIFTLEKFDSRIGETQVTNIPDAGMQSSTDPSVPRPLADPAAVLTGAGNLFTKTGKYTNGADTHSCVQAYNAQGDGRSHIDPACLDSAAQVLKNYYPATSSPYYLPNVAVGLNNYETPFVIGDDSYQYTARGDYNLTASQKIFARYTYMKMTDIPDNTFNSANGFDTANPNSDYFTHQAVLGDTYTVNPTTIADLRLSFTRAYSDDHQPSLGTAMAKSTVQSLGAGWAPILQAASGVQLPALSIGGRGGPDGLFGFPPMFLFDRHWYNNYGLTGSVIKLKGNHTMKFGGEIRLMDKTTIATNDPTGGITTSNDYTGDEWANFLLGLDDSFVMGTAQSVGNYNWYAGLYAADTWVVNQKLTLNLGVRYELPGAVAERQNRGTVLLPNYLNTATGILGTEALVDSAQWSDKGTEPALHNLFSPRLGFAYRVNNNLVVRGGYSLAYVAPDLGGVLPENSPTVAASTQASNASNANFGYTVADPFGTGTPNALAINLPVGRSWGNNFVTIFQNTYAGQPISGPVPTTKMTYMEQQNLSVAKELKGQQSIEVAYAGGLAVHLIPSGSVSLDQPNATQIAAIAACTTANTCTQQQARAMYTEFPAYHNVTNTNPYIGTMNYNSMQVRYLKHFNSGGVIQSGFTWSKSIGDSGVTTGYLDNGADGAIQDYDNLKAERSILSFSMKYRWVTSYVVDLPFGKGKMYLNSLNGAADRLIGGWSVNGISTFQTGQPLNLTAGNNAYTNFWNAGTLRPNYTPGCKKTLPGSSQKRLNEWFNTSCFTSPGAFALGNEARVDSTLLGSGVANWDFSLQKATRITEKTNLQFRMEFFNIFNRRQWAVPNTNVSQGSFGQVTDQQNQPRQMQASLRFSF